MLKQWNKPTLIFIALSMLFGIFTTNTVANTERIKPEEVQDASRETTISGTINRLGDTDIVIDDSLYLLAPGSGMNTSSFTAGQYVGGELDDQRRIRSLHRKEKVNRTKPPTDNANSVGPTIKNPTDKPLLKHEGGVWKN